MGAAAIVLSDLHLGAPNSVLNLTQWPHSEVDYCKHGNEARTVLIEGIDGALGVTKTIDRLVLNGDVVDLSHGEIADGIRELGTLLRLLNDAFTIKECILVFGNHDRQWWDWQCQYDGVIKHLLADEEDSAKTFYRRITDTSGRTDAEVILNPLHEQSGINMRVAYPDYEFVANGKRIRCHHGHLYELLYSIAYSALLRVLEDFEQPKRRDDEATPGNPIKGKAVKRIEKAREQFAGPLKRTLQMTSSTQRGDLQVLEQICGAFINLDWAFLGQSGLLQKSTDGDMIGRAVFEYMERADAFAQEMNDMGEVVGDSPLQMFLTLFALGALDFMSPPPAGQSRHGFSSGGPKKLVDNLLAMFAPGGNKPPPVDWKDQPAISKYRQSRMDALIPAIHRHAARFYDPIPDAYIVGHTHVPAQANINVNGRNMRTFNTGGWVTTPSPNSNQDTPPPDAAIVVVREDGNVDAPVLLQRRLAR